MQDKLFVYGTLMQPTNSAMSQYLQQRAEKPQPGRIKGRLYDLGSYPGLVYDADGEEEVYGEVYQLHHPAETLRTLDTYEGIPSRPTGRESYRRALVPVLVTTGTVWCWTYLYQGDCQSLLRIQGGNYLTYLKGRDAHQRFIDAGKGLELPWEQAD